ncbi:DoxX family membrane protein [Olivibacter sp. XZL3]|uniref:DoxX family membrane protein n=1 Tax=Olivibacter sp. XZL3 TaxID=1735116 RepID=UPI00106488E4|nr:DoxX family membrane protein [Olivibacter sp. XZL3]
MLSHHVSHRAERHHPLWLEITRIVLSLVILWKGLEFIANIHVFTDIMMNSSVPVAILMSVLVHTIIVAHIFGAIALFTGSYVRIACILQMPVVLMALLFRDLAKDVLNPYAAVWVSVAILCALVLVLLRDKHDTADNRLVRNKN